MFRYDPEVTAKFPAIRAGIVVADELDNGPSTIELLEQYRAEQSTVAHRLSEAPLSELPSIRAWRRAFSQFGVKPTQYRSAAEALLRRLDKHGDIPSINTLVDVGNMVSIRYAMPVAVFDRAQIAGPITVRFSTGSEVFTDLAGESSTPDPGEVIFVDEDDVVHARRWCWRQSGRSASGPTTTSALVVVEGHHVEAGNDVKSALSDLVALLERHQPNSSIDTQHLHA